MQRKIFAKQLLMLIRKSGMRQIELAAKIGVSSAAISQFVHGTTLPTPRHMGLIFDVLKIPARTRAQIQYQLMLARSEPRKQENEQSFSLLTLRASHGLSLLQVSARTDISQERLLELEQNPEAVMSEEEKDKLSTLFGINWDNKEMALEEPQAIGQYQNNGAPQIMVSDLVEYDRSEPIDEFAWRNIRNFLSYNLNGISKPVIAQAFSDEVGFRHEGLVQIVLSEVRPTGYAPMELRFYEGGVFRLWQPSSGKVKVDTPSFETHGTVLWSIPVVEVILQPLKNKVNR